MTVARGVHGVAMVWAAVAALTFAETTSAEPAAEPVPQRIASLNLAADEILVDILPIDRLVAVTKFVDEKGTSNALGRVPVSIPRFPKADIERLIAIKPDLVIVSEFTDADFLRALEKSGLRAHRMRGLDSIDGFRRSIIELGEAVGVKTAAEKLVTQFDERMEALRKKLVRSAHPDVFYWASGYTAGKGTPFDALINCGGGVNGAAQAGLSGIAPMGAERIFSLNPSWLLIGKDSTTARELREHPLLKRLRAVREDHIIEMPVELLVALNHHVASSCEFIARRLHSERFQRPVSEK